MDVPLDDRWEGFVREQVRAGHFATPADVVREGLRLVEDRQAKLDALRAKLDAAIERGGAYSDEEVGRYLEEVAARLPSPTT